MSKVPTNPAPPPTQEAYGELQIAFDFYNVELFEGKLPHCLMTFQRQKTTFGYYSAKRFVRHNDGSRAVDEIAVNPEYFAVVPLVEVLQTLVHEMTHLWQEHFGKPSRKCYHNMEFADRMESIGLMPSDTGQPGGKRVGQSMADYLIPGGKFEAATKKLLTTGFAITWLDRYPCRPPSRFMNMAASQSTSEGSGDEEMGAATVAMDADALFAAASVPPNAAQPELMITMKTGNRSNRSKYTCPSCDLNVWGKPDIRVSCMTCDTQMLTSDDEAEGDD